MRQIVVFPWLALLSCAAAACSGAAEFPLKQPVGRTHSAPRTTAKVLLARAAPQPPAPAPAAASAPAHLDICDLPDTRAGAIFFATEDFSLRARGAQILEDIAVCVHAGWLSGGTLLVTGYADPRGDAEYNRELALLRARAVQRYLVSHGVPERRIVIAARGETRAAGSGPEQWVFDRRVEISWAPDAGSERPVSGC